MDLEALRQKIARLDANIVDLLNERASASLNVGRAKKQQLQSTASTPEAVATPEPEVYVPGQERKVFERVAGLNRGPLRDESLVAIYKEIMSASIHLQRPVTIAYLGPAGTFTHQAARSRFGESLTYIPEPSMDAVIAAVESGRVTYGVVPIENSLAGHVAAPFTNLANSNAPATFVRIRAEIYIPIHQALLSKAASLASINRVYSHEMGLKQCSKWLQQNLPGAELITTSSTAAAAELVASDKETEEAAAIGNVICTQLMPSLRCLHPSIQNSNNNFTRFVVLGKECDRPTGDDKTIMAFSVEHSKTGALGNSLAVFTKHNVNLTSLLTVPNETAIWSYWFVVECAGHEEDANAKAAITELKEQWCKSLVVFGSYPNQRPKDI